MNDSSNILLDTFLEYLNDLNNNARLSSQHNRDKIRRTTNKPIDYVSLMFSKK